MLSALFLSLPAQACGGFFGPVGQLIASDAQQAIFVPTTAHIDVTYRVRFTGNAQDFAWVLPVPGGVMSVEEGDESTFIELEQMTAPQVYDRTQSEDSATSGCGCGSDSANALKSGGVGDTGAADGLVITGHGFAGDYEYTILAAEDAETLQTWLTDNGFDVGTALGVLEAYVADERGFEFVAVKIRQDTVELDTAVQFTPLRIRYGAGLDGVNHLDFPALMQSTSTSETNHLELYVLADGRADVAEGWDARALGEGGTVTIPYTEDWASAYNDVLEEFSGSERVLARIYAGDAYVDGAQYWATRFDAILRPSVETEDISFEITDNVSYVSTTIELVEDGDTGASDGRTTAAGLLIGLATLGATRARRR